MGAPQSNATPRRKLSLVERLDAYERLMRLDKPIGTLLLLWPTLSALWLAAHGAPRLSLVLVFCVGTLVMRSAGCAMNDWADRDFDAHVERTAQRPLAARVIAPWEALAVASIGAFAAFLLVLLTSRAAILWSVPALAIAIAYPFFKRFFAVPQAFLGIAFSFGIPMAFAAVLDVVPPVAWAMLVVNLFWVIAYDTEYAMVDRADDSKIGIRTSALTFGRFDVAAVATCYAIFIAGMAWIGTHYTLHVVFAIGLCVAAALAVHHVRIIGTRDPAACFRAFLGNHWLGFAVFAGIALDYALIGGRWPRVW
ncbi:MAG TPA: 4-hydroxybenzoate octaprenyltransferase [Casimicrobiaceae bacterium]|nr:4-hydroxybenzoate octaprenyltransferase [Casimicrobiaceae bacterium]